MKYYTPDKAIHIPERIEKFKENLRAVIQIVREGKSLTDAYGMQIKELHDMSADLDLLQLMASHWEVYCRDNGLHPYTGKKGGMYEPWPGFEKRAK